VNAPTTPHPRPSEATRRRLTPVAPWPAVGSVDEHVRTEEVRLLFQQARIAQLIGIVVAGLVAAALWSVGHHDRLIAWLAILIPVSLARWALVLRFQRRAPMPNQMIVWERAFVFSLVVLSLTWGVGGVWIMPPESLGHQAIVYFFLIGIAGGAVASYAAHAAACILAVVSLMVPATIWFALQDVLELRMMAIGGALYIAVAMRATRRFGSFLRRTFQLSWELQQANLLAVKLARTDDLTGLNNRRAFVEMGRQAMDQARRYNRPLALVMFDIDHFKDINDSFGHAAGDAVLQAVAEATRHRARAADIAGRLGGEEFALLLPETTGADAVKLAERLRADLHALEVSHEGQTIRFSCSFGVAARGEEILVLDTLLNQADQALYRAKRQGRNRVSRDERVIVS
jgi:diguanylate cyclase (GGDEF)-like protein